MGKRMEGHSLCNLHDIILYEAVTDKGREKRRRSKTRGEARGGGRKGGEREGRGRVLTGRILKANSVFGELLGGHVEIGRFE